MEEHLKDAHVYLSDHEQAAMLHLLILINVPFKSIEYGDSLISITICSSLHFTFVYSFSFLHVYKVIIHKKKNASELIYCFTLTSYLVSTSTPYLREIIQYLHPRMHRDLQRLIEEVVGDIDKLVLFLRSALQEFLVKEASHILGECTNLDICHPINGCLSRLIRFSDLVIYKHHPFRFSLNGILFSYGTSSVKTLQLAFKKPSHAELRFR